MKYIKYHSINIEKINKKFNPNNDNKRVAEIYPFRASSSYAALIKTCNDPIWKQCMPDVRELDDDGQTGDPLAEELLSPIPGLIHRYPDRVVVLISNCCPVYCRFCMRKRHVGSGNTPLAKRAFEEIAAYIDKHVNIRDIILSGGDPLMLDDVSLHHVLSRLRAIKHVSTIRIGTRMPVTLPERVTSELCALLKKFQPLYINTHFNHPDEITPASAQACALLADAGIPLGNQSVLLRGVNDTAHVMKELMYGLLHLRVKPYYIHQMDLIKGTGHFRTPISTGLEIMRALRGHISGMGVPHYVIDLPGGKGKVPVLPDMAEFKEGVWQFTTYRGERVAYRDVTAPRE